MEKDEIIDKLERLRQYYGTNLTSSELQYKLESSFPNEVKQNAKFKTILKRYMNQLYQLKQWNQQSKKDSENNL